MLRRSPPLAALFLALSLALPTACATPHRTKGVIHTVKPGENLYRIGAYYDVPVTEILRENGLDDPRALAVGQRLRIPHAHHPPAQEPLLPPPGIVPTTNSPLEQPTSKFTGLDLSALRPNAVSRFRARLEARSAGNEFVWPVVGAIGSGFGGRNGRPHEGVDILAAIGTPIRAAERGLVTFSGRLGDYGNAVVLSHTGGFATVYAHASRLLARDGDLVHKGDVLAEVGETGNATGPHLHFEIRRRQSPRNPLLYLPAEPR